MKVLAKATTIDEVKEVYSLPQKYVITSKLELEQKPPADYETITLVASPEDIDIIKDELLELAKTEKISKETRKLIGNILR